MTPAAMRLRQGSNLVCTSPAQKQGFFVGTSRFAVGVPCGGTSMEHAYTIAALWLALALLAAILANHLRISIALVEICVGMVAAFAADGWLGPNALGANLDWLRFIASVGAVLLTFLAGAELDPAAMKMKLKEVTVVGLFGFLAPFLSCAALARFVLG